jgi:hypothetical protein
MRKEQLVVKIKGHAPIPFTYHAADTMAEADAAVTANAAQMGAGITAVKAFNYGLVLKVRAWYQGQHTDSGQLTQRREKTKIWCMMPEAAGGAFAEFGKSYIEIARGMDIKATNKWLDTLYENDTDRIDAFTV